MYKAYKFRLYPDDAQRILINKTFGCAIFIYNYFLDKCRKNGFVKVFEMCSEIKELYADYPFLKEVDTYFPSSKKCSRCDNKTGVTSNLGIRNWICEVCGNENDRDINASINIMFEGLKIHYQN